METRFELSKDEQGRYSFTLNGGGFPLLIGLKSDSRKSVGIDILHVRRAVRDIHHFVPHAAGDVAFVVLRDTSGEVLGKSPRVPRPALKKLVARIRELAPIAEIHQDYDAPTQSSSH